MTHLVIDGADLDSWERHHSGGLIIPASKRPTVLQVSRDAAEREALRLAKGNIGGLFVVYAPVAIAKRTPVATHVNLRGEVLQTRNEARLLLIGGGPEDEIPF